LWRKPVVDGAPGVSGDVLPSGASENEVHERQIRSELRTYFRVAPFPDLRFGAMNRECYGAAMKTPFDYAVSLCVIHPAMDPDVICKTLEWEAEYRWKVGTPRRTPNGTPLEGNYRNSYCSFDVASGGDGELAACLRTATGRLEKHAAFLRQVRNDGGEIMFYVFWYPNGDTGEIFDVHLLSRMAAIGVELGVNVYDDRHGGTEPASHSASG